MTFDNDVPRSWRQACQSTGAGALRTWMDHGHCSRYRSLSQHQIGTIIRFLLFCLYIIYVYIYILCMYNLYIYIMYNNKLYTEDIDLVSFGHCYHIWYVMLLRCLEICLLRKMTCSTSRHFPWPHWRSWAARRRQLISLTLWWFDMESIVI